MPSQTFTKKERITKRSDFIRRSSGDKVVHTPAYRFVFKPTPLSYSRLGIVVTRKNGNAVFRNRVKRVVREAFRKNKARIQPPMDVIVIRRHLSTYPTYQEAVDHFTIAIGRLPEKPRGKESKASA